MNLKKSTDKDTAKRSFQEKDIFHLRMGHNIGYEQNGKGEGFVRPVIIFKKLNKEMFFGIPLSTQLKEGSFYFRFTFYKSSKIVENTAILAQMRLFSAKRLLNKIGKIENGQYEALASKLEELMRVTPQSKTAGGPEGNKSVILPQRQDDVKGDFYKEETMSQKKSQKGSV